MMNLSQTKLVGLTMQLDLKAREFKKLCEKFEKIKQTNINPNDKRLLVFEQIFQKKYNEIVEINKQLKQLKETEELIEKKKLEKYNPDNLFKNRKY